MDQFLRLLPDVKFPAIYEPFREKSLVCAARSQLADTPSGENLSEAIRAFQSEVFSSFKGIDKRCNLFKSGHVQQIQIAAGDSFSYVKAEVLPK